jgi:hypothetical protein
MNMPGIPKEAKQALERVPENDAKLERMNALLERLIEAILDNHIVALERLTEVMGVAEAEAHDESA